MCHQEEIRIDATTVFVDPYEEADAQVRRAQCFHPGRALGKLCHSSLGQKDLHIFKILQVTHSPVPLQIAQERKKTQLEVAPEAKVKSSQPQPGSQGPQTYRQGVGKYINPAAT